MSQKGVNEVKGWGWSEAATAEVPLASSTAGKITGSPRGTEKQTGERREIHKARKRKKPQPPAEEQPGTLLVPQREQEPTLTILRMSELGSPRLVGFFLESKLQTLNSHSSPRLRSSVLQD